MKKLIQQSNKQFLILITILLSACYLFIFSGLKYYINHESDEKLENDEYRIAQEIKKNRKVSSIYPIAEIEELKGANHKFSKSLTSEYLFDEYDQEMEPYRVLRSIQKINGTFYKITVRQSTIEQKDLLITLGIAISGLFILLILILFFINNKLSHKLWRPFYQNLSELEKFDLQNNTKLNLVESNIIEFEQLNRSLKSFSNKLVNDYQNLKEFTENASHEIQTPLSIIQLNAEELLQELDEENSQRAYAIFKSAKRLSSLNQKLLLLSKLDNQQKGVVKAVNFNHVIEEQLNFLLGLIELKNIEVILNSEEKFIHPIDNEIVEILISNLLSNAINHNKNNGFIQIDITEREIKFSNSTKENVSLNTDKIFNRFNKSNSDSVGLGLSIVLKIIILYNLSIDVSHKDQEIQFLISKKG